MSSCRNCVQKCAAASNGESGTAGLGGATDYVIALAGNPNTGKSTVFNHLTGLRQHTGNWPGKTVARAEGVFVHAGKRFNLVDLPGTYSLLAQSVDEEVARDFVLFGRPDCTVVVCDATVFERNLHLVLQVMEITDRVVVCTNLMDEANRKRIAIESRILERELGVPVVPTAARTGKGLDTLVERIHGVASGEIRTQPRKATFEPELEAELEKLVAGLLEIEPSLPCPRWLALRLLDADERVERALKDGTLTALAESARQSMPCEGAIQ